MIDAVLLSMLATTIVDAEAILAAHQDVQNPSGSIPRLVYPSGFACSLCSRLAGVLTRRASR